MQRSEMTGFSLIELMIVVVVIAILSMVAYPSYRNHIVRANRVAAESFMQEVASKEERYLLDNRQYAFATDLSVANALSITTPPDVSGNYDVSVADDDDTSSVPGYVITAAPKGAQDRDDTTCDVLTLSHRGEKTPVASGSTSRCWR